MQEVEIKWVDSGWRGRWKVGGLEREVIAATPSDLHRVLCVEHPHGWVQANPPVRTFLPAKRERDEGGEKKRGVLFRRSISDTSVVGARANFDGIAFDGVTSEELRRRFICGEVAVRDSGGGLVELIDIEGVAWISGTDKDGIPVYSWASDRTWEENARQDVRATVVVSAGREGWNLEHADGSAEFVCDCPEEALFSALSEEYGDGFVLIGDIEAESRNGHTIVHQSPEKERLVGEQLKQANRWTSGAEVERLAGIEPRTATAEEVRAAGRRMGLGKQPVEVEFRDGMFHAAWKDAWGRLVVLSERNGGDLRRAVNELLPGGWVQVTPGARDTPVDVTAHVCEPDSGLIETESTPGSTPAQKPRNALYDFFATSAHTYGSSWRGEAVGVNKPAVVEAPAVKPTFGDICGDLAAVTGTRWRVSGGEEDLYRWSTIAGGQLRLAVVGSDECAFSMLVDKNVMGRGETPVEALRAGLANLREVVDACDARKPPLVDNG